MLISVNGKITNEKKACFPINSDAFLFGMSVFETVRTYNKKVFRLDDHVGRLYVSADVMGIKPKWGLAKIYKEIARILRKSSDSEVKIRMILTEKDFVVMVEKIKEKPDAYYRKGVKLVSYHGKRNLPRAKKLADPFLYLAKQYATESGAYEALLVDPKTYIRECAYANIFWVNGGDLYTTNKDILFGITRETAIELAEECHFEGIKYNSLLRADEIFITQTTSGIIPAIAIDGQKIGNGKPGKVTKGLMKKFNKLVWNK